MRRFLPQTLPVWVLLIVIAGLMISQVATLYIVSRDRAAANDIVDLYRLNDRAFSLVQLMHDATPEERKATASGLFNATYALTVSDTPAVTSSIAGDDQLAELEDILVGRLSKFGITDARVRRDPATQEADAPDGEVMNKDVGQVERDLLVLAADFAQSDKLTASLRFSDGQWLNFTEPITPAGPILSWDSLPLYSLIAGLIVVMSIWSLRRLTAPYRMMETAVNRIGNDLKSPPIAETGSREIRAAAKAVNAMQMRLREYVEDREHLAAALAHDLRTPLTRMRLRLELLRKSSAREALAHDLADIESIASSVIDFAKFEVTEEKAERIDFWSLVESIADMFEDASFDEDATPTRGLICIARPVALRRCITNLVQNAVTYGKKAHIGVRRSGDTITLTIRDEGPGIPQAKLDQVFASFVRLEQSRNRETGGLGLGLTIARNIARGAGGEISLSNHPGGGLLTELRLPLAA
ncbi:HAMP domain-containing protein [Mesorhizobium sp. M1C.F.Ca.ET.193.01.1.1]|uniref:ATP-binding protein n=2 Tax=Mesorhizobium TaxID=68287 RepID=UPI000FD4C593|nr:MULTISPECIES: ATP-binding protein [unclassified Mesorhizobium]TGT02074.1 HAMP domain-containing protein [bacterium M00.F.Ca.ET.177.01.1.1]TGQ54327.1 HAMP domain-containing protein [Mesorhizobium sp. M1C.F.Ca.ET.210.01.1.1]TGQ72322.1 HAMP domain-containing protein [Mesorhizobium sp. M1C.F.Ca.ET.212.01.1.1]TGR10119.1 HAMP domain-containing protein [Mesorhizobium sp. M1C.F.Ca.ET.204.01.1.1]TGR30722.1 HAMP domain-containing protein [Mesorhizobium sp. M1C.F.Ca.ET.196.01.1.1]